MNPRRKHERTRVSLSGGSGGAHPSYLIKVFIRVCDLRRLASFQTIFFGKGCLLAAPDCLPLLLLQLLIPEPLQFETEVCGCCNHIVGVLQVL